MLDTTLLSTLLIVIGCVVAIFLLFKLLPVALWLTAKYSGVNISIFTLARMLIRRINPKEIVLPLIKGKVAGIQLDVNELESILLAGGNPNRVVDALIVAKSANIPLDFETAKIIDLAGRDVLREVRIRIDTETNKTSSTTDSSKGLKF